MLKITLATEILQTTKILVHKNISPQKLQYKMARMHKQDHLHSITFVAVRIGHS